MQTWWQNILYIVVSVTDHNNICNLQETNKGYLCVLMVRTSSMALPFTHSVPENIKSINIKKLQRYYSHKNLTSNHNRFVFIWRSHRKHKTYHIKGKIFKKYVFGKHKVLIFTIECHHIYIHSPLKVREWTYRPMKTKV